MAKATPPPSAVGISLLVPQLATLFFLLLLTTIAIPGLNGYGVPALIWPAVFFLALTRPALIGWRVLLPIAIWHDLVWHLPLGSQLFPLLIITYVAAWRSKSLRQISVIWWWPIFTAAACGAALAEYLAVGFVSGSLPTSGALFFRWLTTSLAYPILHLAIGWIIKRYDPRHRLVAS